MTHDEAIDFLRPAIASHHGDWADLGAGTGTFTAALAQLLGMRYRVTAVERDVTALARLRRMAATLPAEAAAVHVLAGDLADTAALDTIAPGSLAGVLFGNVLHYFADPLPLLRMATTKLRPAGALVVLEYEGARANPWVPHPVSLRHLGVLADAAGLGSCDVVSETTSRYQGTLYCALLRP
jgi:SAM-dependent methyltransferase